MTFDDNNAKDEEPKSRRKSDDDNDDHFLRQEVTKAIKRTATVAEAVDMLVAQAQRKPKLMHAFVAPTFRQIVLTYVTQVSRNFNAGMRESVKARLGIVNAQSPMLPRSPSSVQSPEKRRDHLERAARAIKFSWLNYIVAGKRLGDMSRAEVLVAADDHQKRGTTMVKNGQWFRLLAAEMKPDQVVREVWSDREIDELRARVELGDHETC
jgi:hypothetical protein